MQSRRCAMSFCEIDHQSRTKVIVRCRWIYFICNQTSNFRYIVGKRSLHFQTNLESIVVNVLLRKFYLAHSYTRLVLRQH